MVNGALQNVVYHYSQSTFLGYNYQENVLAEHTIFQLCNLHFIRFTILTYSLERIV